MGVWKVSPEVDKDRLSQLYQASRNEAGVRVHLLYQLERVASALDLIGKCLIWAYNVDNTARVCKLCNTREFYTAKMGWIVGIGSGCEHCKESGGNDITNKQAAPSVAKGEDQARTGGDRRP